MVLTPQRDRGRMVVAGWRDPPHITGCNVPTMNFLFERGYFASCSDDTWEKKPCLPSKIGHGA